MELNGNGTLKMRKSLIFESHRFPDYFTQKLIQFQVLFMRTKIREGNYSEIYRVT